MTIGSLLSLSYNSTPFALWDMVIAVRYLLCPCEEEPIIYKQFNLCNMNIYFIKRYPCVPIWKVCLVLFTLLIVTRSGYAQVTNYMIDISKGLQSQPVNLDKMGGINPNGEHITVNSEYITRGGIPIIPITGEMHYTRYPNQYWDESIKKLKAGGINMVATYVFWNIHEEKEGKFDWSGDKDLRKFIELCASNNIQVIVRIGPFDHGEIRNGGIPDWLLGKPLTIRTNDPLYLHYVELLYNEIGKQLKGLYYKDGGPIVAVQLENEYQHAASPWGLTYPGQPYDFTVADRDRSTTQEGVGIASKDNPYANLGNDHMRTLKALAVKAGIIAPLYTATGWGYAAIIPGETLPVTAAYAYPTWTAKRELSPFYLYKDLHSDPDYSPVRYKANDYPAFAAELGSGIMTTYTRRPLVPEKSLDALINRCIGGGANGIGYYMYHGGSTPVADRYFFNDEAYGYPKISYDFQAPVGEYGQIRPSFNRLKLIHFFINDFAPQLAPMVTTLPGNVAQLKPDNMDELRYAVRSSGNSGFLFLNNFQDNSKNHDLNAVRINVKVKGGVINIPETGGLNIKAEENAILPFNFDVHGTNLIYATAQLLAKGDDPANPYYVFFNPEGINPEFCFSKGNVNIKPITGSKTTTRDGKIFVNCITDKPAGFVLQGKDGIKINILVINKAMALRCYLQEWKGGRHLVFTDALVLTTDKSAEMLSTGHDQYNFSVYPKIHSLPQIDRGKLTETGTDKLFSNYAVELLPANLSPVFSKSGTRKLMVNLPETLPVGLNDIFLKIDYIGDTGMGFLDGNLVTDEFYKGIPWEIGLKRFIKKVKDNQFGFYFRPIMKGAPYLVDLPASVADMADKGKQTLQINGVTFTPEYKSVISFK